MGTTEVKQLLTQFWLQEQRKKGLEIQREKLSDSASSLKLQWCTVRF